MAWVNYQRILDGTSVSAKFGESMRIVEKWQIRTDSPATSKVDILAGLSGTAGVTWGAAHFEFSALKAMEFDLSPEGRDGMRWILTVTYYVPSPNKKPKENGIPEDVWERAGGTTTIPCFLDKDGNTITNAAGDPLEGLEREREEASWSLTKHFTTDVDLEGAVFTYAGTLNDNAWAGGASKTWKCYFKGAKRASVTKLDGDDDAGLLNYIESHWEFRYDPLTWVFRPWDIGFMELAGSGDRKAILGSDGKPVKQPVALNADGSAKTPGTPPGVIRDGAGADVYQTSDFFFGFGSPFLMPT